jgi:peptidoglycan/LPS O-acetylase OafA/YrhL
MRILPSLVFVFVFVCLFFLTFATPGLFPVRGVLGMSNLLLTSAESRYQTMISPSVAPVTRMLSW